MPRKALGALTEAMFYILMALMEGEKCGVEVTAWIERHTSGRVRVGPGTLYTILGSFLDAGLITETATEGRRRTYAISGEGERRYAEELTRLRQCVADAERKGDTCAENGALPILQAGI